VFNLRFKAESRASECVSNVFSMVNDTVKSVESKGKPRVGFRLMTGELGNYWYMFCQVEK